MATIRRINIPKGKAILNGAINFMAFIPKPQKLENGKRDTTQFDEAAMKLKTLLEYLELPSEIVTWDVALPKILLERVRDKNLEKLKAKNFYNNNTTRMRELLKED